jgi:hypothetical protein
MTTRTERPAPTRRSKAVRLAAVPLIAAAFVAGCGDDEEEVAYCVNAENEVVDDDFCDEDRGGTSGFFILYGAYALRGGTIGRGTVLTGGDRVPSTDRAAVARRGGFGAGASAGGVGRTVNRGGGFGGSSAGS